MNSFALLLLHCGVLITLNTKAAVYVNYVNYKHGIITNVTNLLCLSGLSQNLFRKTACDLHSLSSWLCPRQFPGVHYLNILY